MSVEVVRHDTDYLTRQYAIHHTIHYTIPQTPNLTILRCLINSFATCPHVTNFALSLRSKRLERNPRRLDCGIGGMW